MNALNNAASFYYDVYYISKKTLDVGKRVDFDFMPHHKSYSLAIFLGMDPPESFAYNTFVEFLVFKDCEEIKKIFNKIVKKVENFYAAGNYVANVVVFDLDETIIDEKNKLLSPNMRELILNIIKQFDYAVLWSHGVERHVKGALERHNLDFWHKIMFKPHNISYCKNKSLGRVLLRLNEKYGVTGFDKSYLFDDLPSNNLGEYTKQYIIPLNKKSEYYDDFYKKAAIEIFDAIRM